MKDWIHISHIASCGAGGVCFSLLPAPSPLHSLCKCNRRITQDKALQSRDMMPPFCRDRGIQTYLTWCNQQSELSCVIYLSHWLLGNVTPQGALSRQWEMFSTNTVTRQLINTEILSVLCFETTLYICVYLYMSVVLSLFGLWYFQTEQRLLETFPHRVHGCQRWSFTPQPKCVCSFLFKDKWPHKFPIKKYG